MTQNKDELISIEFRHVELTKESRRKTRKIKDHLWGNVCNAIECPNWHIPCHSYKYTEMKAALENGFKDFFKLDFDVVVESFQTNIIEYDNHY